VNLELILLAVGGAAATIGAAAIARKLSRKLDRRLIVTTLVGLAVGVLAWVYLTHGLLAFQGALLLVAGAGAGWVVLRRGGTARTVTRWGERTRRRSGVATPFQIARSASGWAMHRKAAAVRPHLRDVGWRERWRVPTTELGVRLCRVGGMWLWASVEDVILAVGGPRKGKTAWLAGAVSDAPGAVLTTSTRTEIIGLTRVARERGGRAVWVFNPGGLGDLESTITFDPLLGCQDPTVATARAADMIPETEGAEGDRDFWDGQARRYFAAFLHAAALDPTGRRTMRDVQRWVAHPASAGRELHALLRKSPDPDAYIEDVNQFVELNDKTQSSITNSMTPAMAWLTSQTAVAATQGNTPFDVSELLRDRGTVYLLGRHEAHTAPLLAALTGYVAREARRLAALEPGGRLDPPLTLALDEAARVSPVPLPDWTGDSGGSGIQLMCAIQSLADLVARWGKTGAAKILNNSSAVMLYGGTKDPADLAAWAALAGDRDEPVKTRDGSGKVTSTSVRKTPVLAAAQLASLPKFRVVVFSDMSPAIGRIHPVWKRRGFTAWAPAVPPVVSPTHLVAHPAPAPVGAAPARELTDVTH
jgi:type IV secretion system protein VirD4